MPPKCSEPAANQSVERSLKLLEFLATKGAAISVTEASVMLEINRVTAQTLLNTLQKCRYIERDPDSGKYFISYMMFLLGKLYLHQFPFLGVAERCIEATYARLHWKTNLIVLKPPSVGIIIYSQDGTPVPNLIYGHAIPLHASASGKMLLASLPERELVPYLERLEFRAFTPSTITNRDAFLRDLERSRAANLAVETGELNLGKSSMAAPVRDYTGRVVAAVSFLVESDAFETHRTEMELELTALCSEISAALGYSPCVL